MKISCECGSSAEVAREHVGKRLKCKGCGEILTIREPESEEIQLVDFEPEEEERSRSGGRGKRPHVSKSGAKRGGGASPRKRGRRAPAKQKRGLAERGVGAAGVVILGLIATKVVLGLLGAVAEVDSAKAATWAVWTSKPAACSAEFPGSPKQTRREEQTEGGELAQVSQASVTHSSSAFTLTCVEFATATELPGGEVKAALAEELTGLLDAASGEKQIGPITHLEVEGSPAAEAVLRVEVKGEDHKCLVRVVWRGGRRLYTIMYEARSRTYRSDLAKRFVNSLTLVPASGD